MASTILTGAVVEGLDYEAICVLDSSSFGHGDFGRFTFTLNGTYLPRFELQISPDTHRFGLSGSYVFLPTLAGSLPHTRAFASAFWDGPAHTWLAGFDIGATVHYTGQYEDDNTLLTGFKDGLMISAIAPVGITNYSPISSAFTLPTWKDSPASVTRSRIVFTGRVRGWQITCRCCAIRAWRFPRRIRIRPS